MRRGTELRAFAPTLALLLLAVLINYVDRGNLSLAAPLIKSEWNISAAQLGILFSAFFWSYMSLQFAVGWMVDRWNVNLIMALGFLVWSLSTAATGLATGFGMMLLMRLMLGVGESVMFPASSKICALHLPEHCRGVANAMLIAAIRWGSAVGTFGGGMIMARFGWRHTFIDFGLAGLLWLPAWLIWKPKAVVPVPRMVRETQGFCAIVRRRSFWGAAIGHFCGNYLLYFLISWLPYYLVHERHLSMDKMAGTAGILYAIDSVAVVISGWIADRKIGRGADARMVRKWAMASGFAVATVALMACAIAGPRTYFWCLVGTAVGSGTASAGAFAMGQTLAGPRLAGRWIGLQNGVANLSGIAGPPLTGLLVDWTGHFAAALGVAALVAVVGGFAWVLGVRKQEEPEWQAARETYV